MNAMYEVAGLRCNVILMNAFVGFDNKEAVAVTVTRVETECGAEWSARVNDDCSEVPGFSTFEEAYAWVAQDVLRRQAPINTAMFDQD